MINKNNFIIKLFFIIIFFFSYMMFKKIHSKYLINTALCVVAKRENRYIKEFVEYYKNLGITHIFLYDNNDIEDENFNNILKDYINNNFVKIINYRGLFKPQKNAYKNCYNNLKNNYDWIAFFDADEYLYIVNVTNINDFLSLSKFKKCSSILINWKYYGDNNNLFYKPKPLKERFLIPTYLQKNKNVNKYFYSGGKTIARGKLKIIWAHFPHFLKNKNICRPDGNIIKNPFSPPQFSKAYINHYITKSTEEFAEKTNRGTVYSRYSSHRKYLFKKIINYFLYNKITKEKINILGQKLNINESLIYKLVNKYYKL